MKHSSPRLHIQNLESMAPETIVAILQLPLELKLLMLFVLTNINNLSMVSVLTYTNNLSMMLVNQHKQSMLDKIHLQFLKHNHLLFTIPIGVLYPEQPNFFNVLRFRRHFLRSKGISRIHS